MAHRTSEQELREQEEHERLVLAILRGEIGAIEDLEPAQIALLLSRARPAESLEDLFDRLRQPGRDQD